MSVPRDRESSAWAFARVLLVLSVGACSAPREAVGGIDAAVLVQPDAGAPAAPPSPPAPSRAGGPAGGAGGMPALSQAGMSSADAGALDASLQPDAASVRDAATAIDAAPPASDAGVPTSDAAVPIAQAGEFHGVNWADKRDNFVHGVLQLSGLDSSSDTYDSVKTKTSQIAAQFREQLGANAIRIPINEPTVSSKWWEAYKAVIDTATDMNMNVIVAYWAYQNGKPDDEAAFKAMWQKVVSAYAENNRVFFDIHNEPSGLNSAAWRDEAARWLGYFPALPRGRIIVAGVGSDGDVVPIGSDSRFDGCILQLHYYEFWHKDWKTQKQWHDAVSQALGNYASRTIVGEWGADMASGLDYNRSMPDGDSSIAYITAMADLMRERKLGSCYWPGLRDDDSYAMLKRNMLTLSVVNPSGRDRLRWAWNF